MMQLRGEPCDGVCPGCGERVAAALDGAHFVMRSPWYLARLIRGGRFIFWGNLAAIVGGIAFLFAASAVQTVWIALVFGAFILVMELLVHSGWWMITLADPDALRDPHRAFGGVIRATVIMSLLFLLGGTALLAFAPPSAAPASWRQGAAEPLFSGQRFAHRWLPRCLLCARDPGEVVLPLDHPGV
ncbi:MAG TPA: hypothetical protein VG797_06720 [Phycisphaerales bacterium]|nr:hypothetical protein [Phycisphaerales bacterium]